MTNNYANNINSGSGNSRTAIETVRTVISPLQLVQKINEIINYLDTDNSSRNIGEIVQSTIPLTDTGLHLLDGALLSGNGTYADFATYLADIYSVNSNYFCTEAQWQETVTNYGSCGKFVYDSINNTVRLPKISNILEGTTDINALGDLVEAGLPNITGIFANGDTNYAAGAFQYGGDVSGDTQGGGSKDKYMTFDASRSSSIYGNSTTVQPQTIKVLFYIVVATSAKTDIQVDINNIVSDVNLKADKDLSNVVPSGSFSSILNMAGIRTVIENYANGTSRYRVWSDGYCEQWGYLSSGNNTSKTITLLKEYANTDYCVFTNSTRKQHWATNSSRTTTSFVIYYHDYGDTNSGAFFWKTEGFISLQS